MPVNTPVRANQFLPTPCDRNQIHLMKDVSPPPIPLREVHKNLESPPTPPGRDQVHSRRDNSLQPVPLIEVSKIENKVDPDTNKEPFYLKLLESAKDYRKENSEIPDNISIYDIPYDWPEQVWPEIKRRCALNPLHWRKMTICFFVSSAILITTLAASGSIYYGKSFYY